MTMLEAGCTFPASAPVQALEARLRPLRRHDLAAADALALMRRFDTKFLLPAASLGTLLHLLKDDYSVLALGEVLIEDYENLYLDSPDFRFYAQHHNRKLKRLKVRIRSYRQTGTRFFELKVKNNDRRTVKHRMPLREGQSYEDQAGSLNAGFSEEIFAGLRETLCIGYRRISLLNEKRRERVSIDLDISARPVSGEGVWRLRELAVVEVKQEKIDRQSPAFAALRRLHVRPSPFSKYCVSCNLLFPGQVKKNRFKTLLCGLSPFVEVHEGEVSDGFVIA